MKILKKIKSFFSATGRFIKEAIAHPAAVPAMSIFTSTYYLTFGLMLSIMTLSPIVFMVFAAPALAWWIVTTINASMIERTIYEGVC